MKTYGRSKTLKSSNIGISGFHFFFGFTHFGIWRFPKIGLPPINNPCSWDLLNKPSFFGYPNDYGNPLSSIINHIVTHYHPLLTIYEYHHILIIYINHILTFSTHISPPFLSTRRAWVAPGRDPPLRRDEGARCLREPQGHGASVVGLKSGSLLSR